MDELNRRKAILYTHPTLANCCRNLIADVPPTVIEFGTDTTRTITDIVFSGTAARCPDVRFIFSHAGGTLPFLSERLLKVPVLDPKLAARVPRGVMHELQRFHYDTAWSAHPMALASLMQLVPVSQGPGRQRLPAPHRRGPCERPRRLRLQRRRSSRHRPRSRR